MTPMMRQYQDAKSAHPGCLVLMRMGDFYEAFLDDAHTLSRVCGVTLTARNKDDDNPTAMAGVPHHQLKNYLPKLLAAGLRVAVMDQLEDPAQAVGIVRRGVTRVVSAGTLIDEELLDASAANWLVALTAIAPDRPIGIAALDLSTGRFQVEDAHSSAQLAAALARLAPAEVVLPDAVARDPATAHALSELLAPAMPPPLAGMAAFAWVAADARRWLCERLGVATLDGFAITDHDDHCCAAAAACLRYAEGAARPGDSAARPGDSAARLSDSAARLSDSAHNHGLAHVRRLVRIASDAHVALDAACRRTLELTRNQRDGTRVGTVIAAVDRTRTAAGARLLSDWISRPLRSATAIHDRHDAVAFLLAHDALRDGLRQTLEKAYDVERLGARIATGRAHARDLVWLATSLNAAHSIAAQLEGLALPALIMHAATQLRACPELIADIQRCLVDAPPLTILEGGMLRDGVDAELDEYRGLMRNADAWLADYQLKEATALGLNKLKVGTNSVFGYFIELSKIQAERAPAHFIRKQTLVNAERYITPELKAFEDKVTHASSRAFARESALFQHLRERCEAAIADIQAAADALATLDCIAALADTARRLDWCRPVIDDSGVIDLHAVRHPVVEAAVGRGRFVPNDLHVDADRDRLCVITGPNMAGKSTAIRQVALAVILAQAGSFVPATKARIGLVDRVFTRLGSGDELARGLSTFMVEMSETAAILNHATARSLVVLDEVGRGTSTFDGLALAWAICEYLHDRIGARALFATHYHELTALAEARPGIVNRTVAVAERDGEVVFLHRIEPGAATRSYGIHVAKLAGVPHAVIARARSVLSELEQAQAHPAAAPAQPLQMTLFGTVPSATLTRLKALDLDALTPRQAAAILGELQLAARSET